MIVTIDGPAGAGKSTVARLVAERLGVKYLDTGAFYRAATLAVREKGLDLSLGDALAGFVSRQKITFKGEKVFLNGKDVSRAIRDPKITAEVFHLAISPKVRLRINVKLRAFARGNSFVAEGRDQGSVVFKQAAMKFYLDAAPEERAHRRFDELRAKGLKVTLKKVLADIIERDRRDKTRACSPLIVPKGATVIDSTALSAEQVADAIARLCVKGR